MNKSEKLKSIILSKYKSLREFSAAVGIPNTTLVSALDRGIEGMAIEKVIQICDFLNIDIKTFEPIENKPLATEITVKQKNLIEKYESLDQHGKEIIDRVLEIEIKRIHNVINSNKSSNVIELKYSSCKASAGSGSFLFDDCTDEDITVLYNEYTRLADICICVSGDSMEPKFSDGDILLVRNQPSIEEGEYGIFIKGNDGYVKKKGPDRLISLNPEYEDIYPESENIYCYGKVIGKLDSDWIVE